MILQVAFFTRLVDSRREETAFMGMFDTIILEPAERCPRCVVEVTSLQTKEFDSVMETYRVGSVIAGCSVRMGVIEERLWCKACSDAGAESEWPVYLVIWHSVLAAVECDLGAAERKLRETDRLDLVAWLDAAQQESRCWQHRFWVLRGDLSKWHEHLQSQKAPNDEAPEAWRRMFSLPEEILNDPDPLAALITRHSGEDESVEKSWKSR